MSNSMLPQYSTVLFTDVWEDVKSFIEDYENIGIPATLEHEEAVNTLFYLLYAKYGNTPIANNDITQFKYKIFSIIFQYGPTWEKKLGIQAIIRNLEEADLMAGSKAVYNTALNPSTAPSTDTLDELTYINSQNTTNLKRSKLEAYGMLWEMLDDSLTAKFIEKFAVCFKKFVYPEQPLLYVSEDEEEE